MTTRPALSSVLLPALAAGAALLVLGAAATAQGSVPAFEHAAGAIVAIGFVVAAVLAPPAWTLTAALVLTVFSGQWEILGSPVPLDRVALGIGALSLVIREGRRPVPRLRSRPIDWVLMVIVLYAFVSAAVAGTLDDSHSRFTLLDRYGLVPFALFFLAPIAFRSDEDRGVLIGALVGLGAYLGITAILETTGPSALVIPSYITDPEVGIHFDRARGPFVDAVANGLTLYACAVASVMAFFRWRSPRWRATAVAVAGLCLLGVILTVTRAVWIGGGAASVLALLAARESRRYVVPAAIAGILLVVVALAAIPELQGRVDKRTADQQPVWDRLNSNAAAFKMIEARPLIGFGWGKFQEESPDYYRQSNDYPLSEVPDLHNVYLSNAVELGMPGAVLWALALVAAIGGAILRRGPPELRPWKIGLVAVAVSVAIAWATAPSSYQLPTLLLFVWAGIARGEEPDGEL